MLHEIYLYLTENAQKDAKIFGHLKESIALYKKAQRHSSSWKAHQLQSQAAILKTASQIKNKKKLLIFGAGMLEEIPIRQLAEEWEKIILVDIVYLSKILKKYQSYSNLEFVYWDITECIQFFNSPIKKKINDIPLPQKFLKAEDDFDLIISCNLISQLPIPFQKKLASHYTEKEIEQISFQICQNHFNYLHQFKKTVLLITDIETHIFRSSIEKDIETPYFRFKLPRPFMTWNWEIAPKGEINSKTALQMKVVAIILKQ